MTLDVKMFLIVCPLVFLGSFMDAIAGGGGLITLPAYLLAGLPMHLAIGSNKMSSTIGTTVSTARYWKNYCVDIKFALPSALAAIMGAEIGAQLSMRTNETYLKIVLIVVLPIVAFFVLKNKDFTSHLKLEGKQKIAAAVGVSFLIGIYDGFYGPGTGTFLIMAFTMICGMGAMAASGNAKVVNLSSNVASLITFLLSGKVVVILAGTAAVFSVLGHWFGSGVALKNGTKVIRPVVIIVLGLLFIKIIADLV